MHRPKRIRVLGRTYDVDYIPVVRATPKGKKLRGLCDHAAQRIFIEEPQQISLLKSTVLHEAIHAMADTIGFRWSETTVEQAEQVFFAILRDNPTFARWLIARDDPTNSLKGGASAVAIRSTESSTTEG
jgi:hypothetical protein